MISHDYITVSSSSIAFDLHSKVQTSYMNEHGLEKRDLDASNGVPFVIEGVELDLRMRGFEFFSLVSPYPFDSPRPAHLKATGRIKFQGKVTESPHGNENVDCDNDSQSHQTTVGKTAKNLVGEVSISGLKLNQLMLAPQLAGMLRISEDYIKVVIWYQAKNLHSKFFKQFFDLDNYHFLEMKIFFFNNLKLTDD